MSIRHIPIDNLLAPGRNRMVLQNRSKISYKAFLDHVYQNDMKILPTKRPVLRTYHPVLPAL